MPLKVHHYYPLGSGNIGDQMVVRAIQAHLPEYFGPCEFIDIPVNDRYSKGDREIGLRGANLDFTNQHADLVVIGGSNLLEPRKPRRVDGKGPKRGRWSVFTDLDSIARLKPPSLLLGMGTGSSFAQPIRPYVEPTTSEIRALFSRSFAHAVRDVTTVRQLARIGVQTQCTGCPVTFLTSAPIAGQPDHLPLAISLPPYYIRDYFSGRFFMRGTLAYIRKLHAKGMPILVTLHEDRDVAFAKANLPASIPTFYTESLDEQIDRLKETRGMVGFRLHAALTAMALGKPVIPVGIDHRGLGFIDTINAEPYSIRSGRLFQFSKLESLTHKLLTNDPTLLDHLNTAKLNLQSSYRDFLQQAATRFATQRA